jgi:hypothetical protein
MAGFEVIIYGRFWVITVGQARLMPTLRSKRKEESTSGVA